MCELLKSALKEIIEYRNSFESILLKSITINKNWSVNNEFKKNKTISPKALLMNCLLIIVQ